MMNFRAWLEAAGTPVILVATGAYNPIHRGHVKVFYHAKRFLMSKGYDVVAAYMVPRNYDYINFKSRQSGETPEPDEHRQQMIRHAVQGTFIKVLPLEKERNKISRDEIRAEVEKMHPGHEVFFVAGDDKGGCPDNADTCLEEIPGFGKVVIVGRRLAGDASSTRVRKNLRNQGQEPNLLSPANVKYVHKHRLWGAKDLSDM